MASLNGAAIVLPGRLIALRVACGAGCDFASRTTKIPPRIRPTNKIPTRRFMKHLQEGCGSLVCSRGEVQSKRSAEGDPTDANEIERKRADREPEQNALRERTPADFPERVSRNAGADKKKRGGKAELAEREEFL